MWALWQKQEPPAAAPGDPDPARLLSIATRLSVAPDLGLAVKVVTRVYHRVREALDHVTELDEAYFGGRRGRATAGKSVVFGLLGREDRVYTKVVESVSALELMQHTQAPTKKGSVYFTDAFRGLSIIDTLRQTRRRHAYIY